jgi:hypothetical protein
MPPAPVGVNPPGMLTSDEGEAVITRPRLPIKPLMAGDGMDAPVLLFWLELKLRPRAQVLGLMVYVPE